MKRSAILRPATVVRLALVTGVFAIAQGIAPPPTNLHVVEITPGRAGRTASQRARGSFVVQWDPARIDAKTPFPTYLFSIRPKFCNFVSTARAGQFQQASFTAPPYQVKIQCDCNRSYIATIATVSVVAGVKNSMWTDAPMAAIPCEK